MDRRIENVFKFYWGQHQPDCFFGVADCDDGQDGTEDLLLHDGVVRLHVCQDGQPDVPFLLVEIATYEYLRRP